MKGFLFLILALLTASCFEQGDCSDVSSNVVQVNFYSNSSKTALTIELDSVKMVDFDTLMYVDKDLNKVALPLNPALNSMTYVFYYNNTEATLEIHYKFKTFALAPDCNAIDLITLTEATSVTAQSPTVTQPNLTSTTVENIKLYF
jgi:hypothetical protein